MPQTKILINKIYKNRSAAFFKVIKLSKHYVYCQRLGIARDPELYFKSSFTEHFVLASPVEQLLYGC